MPGIGDRELSPNDFGTNYFCSFRSFGKQTMMPYHHRSSVHSNGYSTDGQQNSANEDSPSYVIEHLATFSVDTTSRILYPVDGMRKLLHLEKTNGIWSQKMHMRLEKSWVLIMDYETGAIMERFPVSCVQEPTAFTSDDSMEMYNNILVFIVKEDTPKSSGSRREMHIFQCQSIPAQDLVEDLKMLREGKIPPNRHSRHIPPPPVTPPPEPPGNGVNVREQVSAFNASIQQSDLRGVPNSEMGPSQGDGDEISSTSSEKYERDVTILNHCFDDIEKFIARLQHAAAASRELEKRRRSRKSKKKDFGEGMLTMRAKPPPEADFIDIFQKFKLSFNLLAKLKAHIHDPNAPELVHFLFTPLALIVDASHDTQYGPNLPAKVLSPLLSREAVNLLINCVTSKETELWHSLGDAWLLPREQWKGYVPPYHPVFQDGWSPDCPTDERDQSVVQGQVSSEQKVHRAEEIRVSHSEVEQQEHYHHDDSHCSSDYCEYETQDHPLSESNRYPYPFNQRGDRFSRDERELSHSPGGSEHTFPTGLPINQMHARQDITARSDISADSIERNGGPGGIEAQQRAQLRWLDELRACGAKIVQVTYPRTANNDKELSVIRGEYLEVIDDSRKWWKARNIHGKIAHVPHTIVTPWHPRSEPSDVSHNPLYDHRGQYASQNSPRGEREMEVSRSTRSPPIPAPGPADLVRITRVDDVTEDEYDDDFTYDEVLQTVDVGVKSKGFANVKPEVNTDHTSSLTPVLLTPATNNQDVEKIPASKLQIEVKAKNFQGPLATQQYSPPLPPPLPSSLTYSSVIPQSLEYQQISSITLQNKEQNSIISAKAYESNREAKLNIDELKDAIKSREKKRSLGIIKTPDVFISQNSSESEVLMWLKAKSFSKEMCEGLKGINGQQILSMQREKLIKFFGQQEGLRLHSQLTIQRNISGFKTTRSSELQEVLKLRQKLIET